jgi:hypothetical protein
LTHVFKDLGQVKRVTRPSLMRCLFVEFHSVEHVENVFKSLSAEPGKSQQVMEIQGEAVKISRAFFNIHKPPSLTLRPVSKGPPPVSEAPCCLCRCHAAPTRALNPSAAAFTPLASTELKFPLIPVKRAA